jgi:hypothetical protein
MQRGLGKLTDLLSEYGQVSERIVVLLTPPAVLACSLM